MSELSAIEKGNIKAKVSKEPDFSLWFDDGYILIVQRPEKGGHLCGYVGVSEDHPVHGIHYSDDVKAHEDIVDDQRKFQISPISVFCNAGNVDLEDGFYRRISLDTVFDVHYGLTYTSDHIRLCGDELDTWPDKWWLGFDTAHSGDIRPHELESDVLTPRGEYRDFEYVTKCTKRLKRQLVKVENNPHFIESV